jgi:hypothetical protein
MRKRPIAIAILLAAVSAMPAAAADNGQITAEVTPAAPCLIVGENLDFGTRPFSTETSHLQAQDYTSFANCSAQAEKIYVRGTDATSSTSAATWRLTGALPCNIGPNFYALNIGNSTVGVNLSTTDQLLAGAVAVDSMMMLTGSLIMPCSGSSGAGERMTMSVIFTASF